jgi:GntR family transcriptional repressor for pyruvate dehydrogenase complex
VADDAHVEFTLQTLREIREHNARVQVSLRRIGRTDLIDSGA